MATVQRVASHGAIRQQTRLFDVISNNLSNVQTVGFKRHVPIFSAILGRAENRIQYGQADGIKTLFDQGPIQKTSNTLDLAIDGEGFFKVKTPDGIRYTRAGNLGLDKEKVLKTADGFPVLRRTELKTGEGSPVSAGTDEITINGQNIVVEKDGTVKADGNEAGQIALVTFPNLSLLRKEGQSLFRLEVPQDEIEANGSLILQGALESSNVNLVGEMIDLVDSMRSYEACLKVIQSDDELSSKMVNDVGKV